MRKYIAEAIGTYCLVFAGCGAIVIDQDTGAITHVGIALTFGLVVMAMIYAVGDISGAHLNPAVTIGFRAAGRIPTSEILPYILAQLAGAFAACVCLRLLFDPFFELGSTVPKESVEQSFVLELILTAILMFVILCVSTGGKEKGIMAGAAVGAVIALEAMFAGPICGASMNPARSLAPAVVSGMMNFEEQWLYLVAPVLGSLVGCIAFAAIKEPTKEGSSNSTEN